MLAQAMAEMYKKETGRCGRLGDQQSDCATRAGRGKLARFYRIIWLVSALDRATSGIGS